MPAPARPRRAVRRLTVVLVLAGLALAACQPDDGAPGPDDAADERAEELTVYSGRSAELVGPVLEQFGEEAGVEVAVRYGDTAEMAATILEEGEASPADVFFAQDAGALGALRAEGMLAELPDELVGGVDERFRAGDGTWVGVTGRARVLTVNTDRVADDEVPDGVLELTGPEWAGRVGWAPTNGSFQAFVTAMRLQLGDEATLEWLEGMLANDVREYPNNTSQVEAVGAGEIDVGIVNHYYLYRFLAEDPDFPAVNVTPAGGDPGAMVNVAGVGVLDGSDHGELARELVAWLLDEPAQRTFAEETVEYPLAGDVPADDRLTPLERIETPPIDLSGLDDLGGTLELLREAGAL